MIQLSGCAEALYTDLPFVERIEAIARLGIPAFEFWAYAEKDLTAIAKTASAANMICAGIVCDTGGPLVDAANRDNVAGAVVRSIDAAKTLDCRTMIVTVGQEIPGVARAEQHQSIVEGLKIAAPLVEAAGITLVLEPLNILVNHVGYYLSTTLEGIEILDKVASPNVKLLYDVYHQQITEGNLIETIERYADRIGHFHMADVPGRHQPGTGEINYDQVFRAISETAYDGCIGIELWPTVAEDEALAETIEWAAKHFG
jgi:hydroxypyruvate isomerase